jgi:hypothetical protein
MVLNGGIDRRVVKDAVPKEPIDTGCDLGQHSRYLGRVLRMAFRDRGGHNPTLGLHTNRQFLPALVRLFTVLLAVPCPLTTDLQAATVHDEGERFCRRLLALPLERHGRTSIGQRRANFSRDLPWCTWDVDGVVCGAPSCAAPLAAGIGHGSRRTLGAADVKSTSGIRAPKPR